MTAMRYRLRTLLILLTVGPPMLAAAWLIVPRIYNAFFAPEQVQGRYDW
jgi:hypothetical protein